MLNVAISQSLIRKIILIQRPDYFTSSEGDFKSACLLRQAGDELIFIESEVRSQFEGMQLVAE